VTVGEDSEPKAGDDAATAKWYDLETMLKKGNISNYLY
jgi:hypothetical protein